VEFVALSLIHVAKYPSFSSKKPAIRTSRNFRKVALEELEELGALFLYTHCFYQISSNPCGKNNK
jgi:hypothetical protein